jgi:hypothetical protein
MTLSAICAKACAGGRLSPAEGLDLLAHAELLVRPMRSVSGRTLNRA